MFIEQEKSRSKHDESSRTKSGLIYEERLKTELELSFAKRSNQKDVASDFYYSPRNSEAIYETPSDEKKIECFAKLRCRKTNNNKQRRKMTDKLFICQIIVVLTCFIISCINVYSFMQFKHHQANPSFAKIEACLKELKENGKSLKQYVKKMENNTKYLLDLVVPLQAYVCYNFNLSRAERKVLGCVTGYKSYK